MDPLADSEPNRELDVSREGNNTKFDSVSLGYRGPGDVNMYLAYPKIPNILFVTILAEGPFVPANGFAC